MSDFTLNSFPSDKEQALAMLFVQSQDLSNLSPEELLDMYDDVYARICKYAQHKLNSQNEWL